MKPYSFFSSQNNAVVANTLVFESADGGPSSEPARIDWRVRKAQEVMAAELHGSLKINEVAARCHMSRSHFTRAFKQATGVSPQTWLLKLKLEKALALLLCKHRTMSDISLESGFCDQPHFTRTFSRSYGITPAQWRKNYATA
jgi:transcriptional regulator GlxA family with amidase domain